MKSIRVILTLSLILVVTACNTRKRDRTGVKKPAIDLNKSNTNVNKTSELEYNFSVSGCSTGLQKFESNQLLCEGLQNATLNKACALELRKSHFTAVCAGQTFKETDPYLTEKPDAGSTKPPTGYDFEQRGCFTGRHDFKTTEEMCVALKDNAINKGCAIQLRDDFFKLHCKE